MPRPTSTRAQRPTDMPSNVLRSMFVPDRLFTLAASVANACSGQPGWFSCPLSPTGAAPATWHLSSGLILHSFASLMPLDKVVTSPGATKEDPPTVTVQRISAGRAQTVRDLAAATGLDVPLSAIDEIFAEVYVLADGPEVLMQHLGLQMVVEG